MKVYVTGYTGYVGRLLCEEFEKEDFELIRIGRQDGADIQWDLCSSEFRGRIASNSVVVHAAGISDIRNYTDEEFYICNQRSTLLLAQACLEAKIKKFIFFSSCSVYAPANETINLETKPNPQDVYGASKFLAEKQLINIFQKTEVELIILRPASIYGEERMAHQSSIARLKDNLRSGRFLFIGSGDNYKSFVHVTDVTIATKDLIKRKLRCGVVKLILSSQSIRLSELVFESSYFKEVKNPKIISIYPFLLVKKIIRAFPFKIGVAERYCANLGKWTSNYEIDGAEILNQSEFKYRRKLL